MKFSWRERKVKNFGNLKTVITATAMDSEFTKNFSNLWAASSEFRYSGEDRIALSLGANGRAVIVTDLETRSLKIANLSSRVQ